MQKFIKYKRFELKTSNEIENIQPFFDDLIKNSWEIIYYNEIEVPLNTSKFEIKIVVVAGKRHTTL